MSIDLSEFQSRYNSEEDEYEYLYDGDWMSQEELEEILEEQEHWKSVGRYVDELHGNTVSGEEEY